MLAWTLNQPTMKKNQRFLFYDGLIIHSVTQSLGLVAGNLGLGSYYCGIQQGA